MLVLRVDEVKVGENRQRREFDPESLGELVGSIRRFGLMHPIVVRPSGDGWTLVAGERRLRAIKQIALLGGGFRCNGTDLLAGQVAAVTLGELSPLDAEEAELEENVRRKDLTWQERASAVARLHNLRTQQAQAIGGQHTVALTAKEIEGRSDGFFHEKTRRALITSSYLDRPEVAKAKTLDEAFKILRKQEQVERAAEKALSIGRTYNIDNHSLVQADCLEFLGQDLQSYDVIITDPPYGISADEFGTSAGYATGVQHAYDDSVAHFKQLMPKFFQRLNLVVKPQCHLYLFCDIEWFVWLKGLAAEAGWRPFRTPLIMVKDASGRVPWPDKGPRRQYELVLFASRGEKLTTSIQGDVFTVAPEENVGHPAQKTVAAYVELLRRSVTPGDWVLDPFCGTGPVFSAATQLKCYATGIELSQAYYGMAADRLESLKGST